MINNIATQSIRLTLNLLILVFCSVTQATEYSPPVAEDYPRQVFWGDTHLHTNQSADAFTFRNHTIDPERAYRFARGEQIESQTGVKAKLARPLDFLMVSDHAEFMGIFPKVFNRSSDIVDTDLGKRWIGHLKDNAPELVLMEFGLMSMGALEDGPSESLQALDSRITPEFVSSLADLEMPRDVFQSNWEKAGETADRFNEPGLFTAFIGYEWTSMPGGNNLHRNILFRDNSSRTSQLPPFSSLDSGDPEEMWKHLARYEQLTGGQVLAIPHNGNASNGKMFADTNFYGEALSRNYAERRKRWEPLVEVTQIKGDGETHSFLSPNDEFADYETWDKANLQMTVPKTKPMLEFEYARSALKNGLRFGQELGINPFEFGMIGSTDAHTGLATADEDNFYGKMSTAEPAKGRGDKNWVESYEGLIELKHWETVASGYAAIWASDNTREALFDAMKRRETYATTGPRIALRFFGGWEFVANDLNRSDLIQYAYQKGVPMGGELLNTESDSPTFIITTQKDPIGANLDRIQIVKGWVDKTGQVKEKVYTVAASDSRKIRGNKVRPVGNTVDVDNASYSNAIGDPVLATVWSDSDFDAAIPAFYYVRVLEIPTPRWTTYDAKVFGEALDKRPPAYHQERAYSSPIWYKPAVTN